MSLEFDLARPIGELVTSPDTFMRPERKIFQGKYITLDALKPIHAGALFPLVNGEANASLWDYMSSGPFSSSCQASFETFIVTQRKSPDPLFWAIIDPKSGEAIGWVSLMRIDASNKVIEVGNVLYTQLLQRTVAATEVIYLLASYVFDELQYRRFEWKCNNLNAPSKRAAERLGFTFEGIFRKHMIVKGRNRDTAWFSIVDTEWPTCKAAMQQWLSKDNFDENGRQKQRLQELRSQAQ